MRPTITSCARCCLRDDPPHKEYKSSLKEIVLDEENSGALAPEFFRWSKNCYYPCMGIMPVCCSNPSTSMLTQASAMRLFSRRKITIPVILPVLPEGGMPRKGPF